MLLALTAPFLLLFQAKDDELEKTSGYELTDSERIIVL